MIKDIKTLYAGYFAGEFGWQLMRWQAHLRFLSSKYDKIVVGCENPYRFLYSDFTDKFMDFEGDIKTKNMWLSNGNTYSMIPPLDSSMVPLSPSLKICLDPNLKQTFIKYGKPDVLYRYDVLIHARNINNLNTQYRNWPQAKWSKLVKILIKRGLSVASIGSKDGAYYIGNTDDIRGVPLDMLADVMASSGLLLTPSSGPAHFASLCGLKHIVWGKRNDTGVVDNKQRYEKDWNPLGTECKFIDGWQPDVNTILAAI